MDKHIQAGYDSPEGTVAATNLGRNNIHVLPLLTPVKQSQNSCATVYCDFWTWHNVCSFYKNSTMKIP